MLQINAGNWEAVPPLQLTAKKFICTLNIVFWADYFLIHASFNEQKCY